MQHETFLHEASVITADELALALYDEPPEVKINLGIEDMDMPTLVTAMADAARGHKVLSHLGYNGSYYVKAYKGTQYVILKGIPDIRPLLKGTRYLATNPKVVRLGIGPLAASSALKANFILSMTMFTAADIAAVLMGDPMTLSQLMGNAIFNAASGIAGAVAQIGVGAVATWAGWTVAPTVLAGIAVGVFVSMLLNDQNANLQLSAKLAEMLEAVANAFNRGHGTPNAVSCPSCQLPETKEELIGFANCMAQYAVGLTAAGERDAPPAAPAPGTPATPPADASPGDAGTGDGDRDRIDTDRDGMGRDGPLDDGRFADPIDPPEFDDPGSAVETGDGMGIQLRDKDTNEPIGPTEVDDEPEVIIGDASR